MSWVKQIVEFLEKNYQIVKENFFLFAVWTILCIGLSLAFSSWNNKRLKNKITDLTEKIVELKSENEALQTKYLALDKKYNSMDEKTRLLLGANDFPCTTAKTMSQNIAIRDFSKKE